MEEKLQRKQLRRGFSALGWALLIYMLIMNLSVYLVAIVDAVVMTLRNLMSREPMDPEAMEARILGNGLGYLISIAVGLVILRLWKGKDFCRKELWTRGKPMKVSDFFLLLCVFLGGQMVFQLVASMMELILNQFGLSALQSVEAASITADTFSMFLYIGIAAPIAEELLFRGLVLRTLMPWGKGFAVMMSAFLFGIFHGNLVQIPFAFVMGLVLGYVAAEHNILWAMVLHMINNLVLSDMFTRLTAGMPEMVSQAILGLVLMAFGVAAIVILILRRKDVGAYFRENRIRDQHVCCFFTAPGIVTLTALMYLMAAVPLLMQLI